MPSYLKQLKKKKEVKTVQTKIENKTSHHTKPNLTDLGWQFTKDTINEIFQIYSGNWLKHSTGKKTWSYTTKKRSSTWIPTNWFHNFLPIISWKPCESREKSKGKQLSEGPEDQTILEALLQRIKCGVALKSLISATSQHQLGNNINEAQNNITLKVSPGS